MNPDTVFYQFVRRTPLDPNQHYYAQQSEDIKSVTMSDSATWHHVLREFTNYLSGIYGYDITGQVFVQARHLFDGIGEAPFTALNEIN